jgi:hypothetical protein
MWAVMSWWSVSVVVLCLIGSGDSFRSRMATASRGRRSMWATKGTTASRHTPIPGKPVVVSVDQKTLTAVISIAVDGKATEAAFSNACMAFNEVIVPVDSLTTLLNLFAT